jgi:hypothetical protein
MIPLIFAIINALQATAPLAAAKAYSRSSV